MIVEERRYPGELASPQQIHELADGYHKAATMLLQLGRPRKPLTRAPFRLSAIHAIELYLTALLLHCGQNPNRIRKLQHDLSARTELALEAGLCLRTKTASHLRSLSQNREYLVTRYGPELAATVSQINRLTATLEEVAAKVTILIAKSPRQQVNPVAAGEVQVRDSAASLSAAPAS
ncbi:hypothetical protein FJ420_31905 [Mesorhizobium sp. B3-1-3]|uniref:hypothetical protein n=1 Tax=unclassified Mesorhizobium TaxID=325217 RepID=UPI001128C625|nr:MULTISPECIES: hypothetical protein [unclassified Mesorhizobium]TPI53314.1 hypothetical protein FJ424_32280 [Mesorhizobium sp. B3-1-8]TPI60081.1 hypothetical protein FJ420_31905 [Mesorhizobium sp. B3-1-3]